MTTGDSLGRVEEPDDRQWEHVFGVIPERDTPLEEAWVRVVSLVPEPGEELRVSWDLHGASVRLRWTQAGTVRLNLYREGVVRLSIPVESRRTSSLRLDYRQDGLTGVAYAEVWPRFAYTDTLMHAG